MHILEVIENEQKKSDVPSFKVGDSVRVHTKVVEGDKERVQLFTGIVIGRKGTGLNENFTVRRPGTFTPYRQDRGRKAGDGPSCQTQLLAWPQGQASHGRPRGEVTVHFRTISCRTLRLP